MGILDLNEAMRNSGLINEFNPQSGILNYRSAPLNHLQSQEANTPNHWNNYWGNVLSGQYAKEGLQNMLRNPQDTALNFMSIGMVKSLMGEAKNIFGNLKSGPALTLTPNTIGGEGSYRITHWLDGQPIRHIPYKTEAEAQQAFQSAIEGEKRTQDLMK